MMDVRIIDMESGEELAAFDSIPMDMKTLELGEEMELWNLLVKGDDYDNAR